jgi:anti-anti-sigma factor
MRMQIRQLDNGRTIVCKPIGDLDRFTFADFAAQMTSIVRPNVHVVFDLSELGSVDSSGVRALRAVARRVMRCGGTASVQTPLTSFVAWARPSKD